MRIAKSKFSFFMYLSTTIILVSAVLLFGCTMSSLSSNQGDVSKVRQPKGNPEAFWDALEWTALTPAEQTLWEKLGWNEANWRGKAKEPVSEIGEQLVCQLWSDMKKGNIESIKAYISSGFQSVHEDGARNYEEELELIKGLDLGEYTLSDFKVTEDGPLLIVTYSVTVAETLVGKRFLERSSMRMSAFLKTLNGWKWIAHANLNPLN